MGELRVPSLAEFSLHKNSLEDELVTPSPWTQIYAKYLIEEEIARKLELAEKLIATGKKLTRLEKEEIYRFLTGGEPNSYANRGRPTTKWRDLILAMKFLAQRNETKDSAKTIMKKLAKMYNLPGADISETQRNIDPQTFYKAIDRGIKLLEASDVEYIDAVEKGEIEDNMMILGKAKTRLRWIKEYKSKCRK